MSGKNKKVNKVDAPIPNGLVTWTQVMVLMANLVERLLLGGALKEMVKEEKKPKNDEKIFFSLWINTHILLYCFSGENEEGEIKFWLALHMAQEVDTSNGLMKCNLEHPMDDMILFSPTELKNSFEVGENMLYQMIRTLLYENRIFVDGADILVTPDKCA